MSTATEVRSPTSTKTSTSTRAHTQGNITVTGGAGEGATTTVILGADAASEMCEHCGGAIGPDGLSVAAGGDEYEDDGEDNQARVSSAFADAVRERR